MSYENAPATKMLATHCACCARPLVDAVSVEIGIGPDCREKYGYNIAAEPANRKEANTIVRDIALNRKSAAIPMLCARLTSLGFVALANKLVGKLAKVVVSEKAGMFAVKTPYNEALVAAMRGVPGRRWVKEEKLNYFPVAQKAAVNALLVRFFEGEVAVGPKGVFIVGRAAAPVAVAAPSITPEHMALLGAEEQEAVLDGAKVEYTVKTGVQSHTCEWMDGEPCSQDCNSCPHNQDEADLYRGPQPGTWAYEAREMVRAGLMSGDEADRWKDEMKDRDF